MRFRRLPRPTLAFFIVATFAAATFGAYQLPSPSPLTPDIEAVLGRISSDSLEGHLTFLASDLLEGRDTPSRGLDIAAEYIAAQFRRAGLEPVGDDGYFQTAHRLFAERDLSGFELQLQTGVQTVQVGANQVSFTLNQGLALAATSVLKLEFSDLAALNALDAATAAGKVIVTEMPDLRRLPQPEAAAGRRSQNEFLAKLSALKPALVVSIDRHNPPGNAGGVGRLIDPENRPTPPAAALPLITVHSPRAVELYDVLAANTGATLSVRIPAPVERPVQLRNVIGVLRGSDPVLKDTYVLLTAHYDHVGVRPGVDGDAIFNGANDDGSGTVSVIEIAAALATLQERPKRTIVFMTVFGEEKGLLGSRFYGRNPIFPIEKTVANLNLEQVGRTDSDEGPQIESASMTGFDFSEVGAVFRKAGEWTGIRVYKHEQNSDAFFGRSDNQALADQGVPAHSLCVAFNFPDYHAAGDHADKVDYVNMAKVDRMVALGLLMIANNPESPKWNEANPRTTRYVEAWKKRRGQ